MINIHDVIKEVGTDISGKWMAVDRLEEFAKKIMPQPLDENRLDEYLPAWAYLEMTEGMRKEIVEVIQRQLGVIE
jgi:hypothetical protein